MAVLFPALINIYAWEYFTYRKKHFQKWLKPNTSSTRVFFSAQTNMTCKFPVYPTKKKDQNSYLFRKKEIPQIF